MPTKTIWEMGLIVQLAMIAYVRNGDSAPLSQHRVRRCGDLPSDSENYDFNFFSRIVGGRKVTKGQHPWMVSLKRKGSHYCGGTIVSRNHVITAAHCVIDKDILDIVTVHVGETDLDVTESSEKTFSVKAIARHPIFHRERPINYDAAVLILNGSITFDRSVFPACLPNPDDVFEPGSLCVALGWGRLEEQGLLPRYLQEVYLPIIQPKDCTDVMETLKPGRVFNTIICAGFPEGGRDACQGDSGGPLMCQRAHGSWVLVGVTSWGMGCGRKWTNNNLHPLRRRGSPGVFTDMKRLIRWFNEELDTEKSKKTTPRDPCSVKDGVISEAAGKLQLPGEGKKHYENNELCTWNIKVPDGKHILLNFSYFDIETDSSCDLDYLALYSDKGHLIGKYCGTVPPRPILISSARAVLKFISDFQQYGRGFEVDFSATEPNTYEGSGCGSLAVHFEEGELQSMNYPENYINQANCHWVIHAPELYQVKLTFEDFQVESSDNCVADSLVVSQGPMGDDVIGKYCGFNLPPSVQSSRNIMQIKFLTDISENYRGFRVTFSFVSSLGSPKKAPFINMEEQPVIQKFFDKKCGGSSVPPRFLSRSIVDGEEAIPYSWPWHVSLQFEGDHVCNGVLISEKWILTSAYCVFDRAEFRSSWLVVSGIHDLLQLEHNQKRSVEQFIVHPKFSSTTLNYDLALIQVTEPFKLNGYVRPICLPEKSNEVAPSSLCVVTGWNFQGKGGKKKSTKLQQLEAPVLIQGACKAHYAMYPGGISDRVFCAGFPSAKDNYSCPGQTGSPLVCRKEDTQIYSIFGIVSFGVNCRMNLTPGVYTNIPLFIDWITQTMNMQDYVKSIAAGRIENMKQLMRTSVEESHPENNSGSQQGVASDNNSSIHKVHLVSGCRDKVLRSPGEIRLDSKDQIYPDDFRCQWRIVAPKDKIIKLELKQLNTKCCYYLKIYEGISREKVLKDQLTGDMVPRTLWSAGPALTVEMVTRSGDPILWFSYSFHDKR